MVSAICIGLFGIALFSSTLLSFSTFQCKMLGYVTSSIIICANLGDDMVNTVLRILFQH